jgi:hypothetical protein
MPNVLLFLCYCIFSLCFYPSTGSNSLSQTISMHNILSPFLVSLAAWVHFLRYRLLLLLSQWLRSICPLAFLVAISPIDTYTHVDFILRGNGMRLLLLQRLAGESNSQRAWPPPPQGLRAQTWAWWRR